MRKTLYFIFVLLSVYSCKDKNSQLYSEYKELIQIQERQVNKIQQLKSQKELFVAQISDGKSEIQSIIGTKPQSYNQISNNIEIENKLKLIQRRLAYANKLQEFEDQTFQALQITNFTIEDIKDKIALGNILGEDELNQILADIDKIKKTSLPETDNLALNIQNSDLQSYEDIWTNIIQNDGVFASKFDNQNVNEVQNNYQKVEKDISNNSNVNKKKKKKFPNKFRWIVGIIGFVLMIFITLEPDVIAQSSFWIIRNIFGVCIVLYLLAIFCLNFFYEI